MFNWSSAPTFVAMLLYWLLAAYVLTRSPRGAISLTAVGAQVGTAAYLLGQGMQANAQTLDEWLPWARNLAWGSHLAHVLWYWLTVLLLREQPMPALKAYLRWIAYPLGVLFALAGVTFTTSVYTGDLLHLWSRVGPVPPEAVTYGLFELPQGALYIWFVLTLAATTTSAFTNVFLAWRHAPDPDRRLRLAWLLVSAALFALGANSLGIVNWLTGGLVITWVGHLFLAAAMVVMAWNVAAYSLLFKGQVIRTDFFYFLTAMSLVAVAYGALFAVTGVELRFPVLALAALTLTLVVLSHALVDIGRSVLDRFFFRTEVQRLRGSMAAVVQSAAMAPDLEAVLAEAQQGISEASMDHLVSLTEQALRRLNSPAALAESALLERLPHTLSRPPNGQDGTRPATPLERAKALRETLVEAIERLKPPQQEMGIGAPAALQYNILRDEYLQGLPNKNIMVRHAISEGTFHRNRRQAISSLARELKDQEEILARG